jgi:hypothetical protein
VIQLRQEGELRWHDPDRRDPEPTLPSHSKAILGALIAAHPSRITTAELATRVGLLENSAAFERSIRILRSAKLVVTDGSFLLANAKLFVGFE